jgi:hypothetical protein
MEPPAKRSRRGPAAYDDVEADDELFLEPDDINAQRDPAVQLERARAVATYKLKSRWEHIFEKYGRDFGDEGDEIDLATGEVVVDNGHIRSMDDANDAKAGALSDADEDEEDRILRGKTGGGQQLSRLAPGSLMRDTSYHGRLPGMSTSTFGTPRLSTMFSPGVPYPSPLPFGSFSSLGSFLTPNRPVEPTWEVPELPVEAYEYSARSMARVTPRKVVRKTLAAAQDSDGDNDDILLGVTTSGGEGNGGNKPQAGRLVTPAIAPQARLLSVEAREASAESASELGSTAHNRAHDPNSAATPDHILEGPESSSLPTPPPTDPELDQASRLAARAEKPQSTLRRRGRQIEVVIIQHSKKKPKPAAPPDVAPIMDNPLVSETGGDIGEGTVGLDQGRRNLAVHSKDCDAVPGFCTDKSSNASKVRRRQGTDILVRTTPSGLAKPNCGRGKQGLLDEQAPLLKSPQLPNVRSAAVVEEFSRNMIDSTYDFSDEDAAFLPRPNMQHGQRGVKEANMLREATSQPGGSQVLMPEAPPFQESLSTSKGSPPRGKAYLRDRPRLPTASDSNANTKSDAKKPVRQDEPTADKPVASMELHKLVQPPAGRRQQVTGRPEGRTTRDKSRAPVLEDISQVQASSSVQAETITTAEILVSAPQASHAERSVSDKRKRPETVVEEWEAPPVSHSPKESVAADGSDIESVSSTEKPVINPPVPTSKAPCLDSSLSKGDKQPLPSTSKEDVRIIDLPLEADEQQPKTPSHRTARTPPSRTCPSSSKYSASKLSIMSLVSDDEDELSLTLDQISPLKVQSPKKRATPLTVPKPKPSTPGSSVKRLAIDKARMVRLKTRRSRTGWRRSSGMSVSSPAADFVRTPGGTMRKCGEDGFKCERDFCFVCL